MIKLNLVRIKMHMHHKCLNMIEIILQRQQLLSKLKKEALV